MKALIALFVCTAPLLANVSESAALASGYAAAFECLDRSTASIHYIDAVGNEVIKGVRELRAFGGVVAIRKVSGEREILDPARIIRITAP